MTIPQVRTSFLSSTSLASPISPTSPLVSTLTSHFVQALHDYLPSNSNNQDVSCLFFKKGSIIEVFNRDNSGWWDGQLGGVRGWFPSNYVGRIGEAVRCSADFEDDDDELELWRQKHQLNNNELNNRHDFVVSLDENTKQSYTQTRSSESVHADFQINNLMDDMAQTVSDLVDSYAHPLDANVQINVYRVVSCVRSLLTHANMVEKESPLLKIYPELARQRKIVLSALSRLILKGKELESGETPSAQDQQDDKNNIGASFMNTTTLNNNTNIRDMAASITSLPSLSSLSLSTENTATNTDQVDHISNLADGLLNEIDIFETMTSSIPRETSTSTATTDSYMTSRSSSFFQQSDTSRSSFSSSLEHIPVSNNSSSSSLLLRQHITEARHSNTFYSITGDADSILQIMLDHQTSIDELMSLFLMTLERFLENKNKRAAEILEVTRRAVDAVRSFLSVVEHVCSNDNRRFLNEDGEEENSELISLVLAKEYVYSSITNLVTAVRALTAGGTAEQDFGHLEMCCENVVHTTNECAACVRIGLDSMRLYEISRFNDVDYTQLSLLGKKISSLHALQHHHNQLSGLPEEAEQYRKELRDSVKSMDGIMRVKPSMSDSAIQSSFQKQETRPRAASLDSYKPTQLSKISPMAAAFPLPPAVNTETTSKETTKKKEPSFLGVFSENEMMFNAEGEVTGATIEALVRKLTLHEKSPDLIFTKAFFYNFRVFTSPDVFIDLLKKRFTLSTPSELKSEEDATIWRNQVLLPIRLRVYNVIKTWLENYFNFEQDAGVEKELLDFVNGEMGSAMPGPAKRMIELINKIFSSKGLACSGRKHTVLDTRLNTSPAVKNLPFSSLQSNSHLSLGSGSSLFSNWSSDLEKPPASIITRSLRNSLRKALHQNMIHLVHVHDIDAVELARQITFMETNLFCRIRPNEMVGQEFKKRSGKNTAIHVKAMIQRSTQITNWVCDTILKENDTKKRVQVLKYWIKVGDACLQLNNYNTLMAIRSALDSTSIMRLRKTWDHLSTKYKVLWEPIYRATDSQRNFAEYRKRLKTAVAPCLPFLGVYLTDLTFINDGNPDFRVSTENHKLINFDKYIKVTRVLTDIDQFQIGYRFLEIDEIQTFISRTLELVEMDDQVLYSLSLKREPKEDHLDV